MIGHGPMLDREEGAVSTLRQLGATIRSLDLWDDPVNLITDDDEEFDIKPRALVFEALDRPDLAVAALRAVRKEPFFDSVGAIIAVTVGQVPRIEPSSGFDDFVLHPYVPEELYGRIRALEWRRPSATRSSPPPPACSPPSRRWWPTTPSWRGSACSTPR